MTYYTPRQLKNGKRNPSGMIYDSYHNYRNKQKMANTNPKNLEGSAEEIDMDTSQLVDEGKFFMSSCLISVQWIFLYI